MLKSKIVAALIAVAGLGLAAGAQAQVYVGGTVGQSYWNVDCTGTASCKKNDTGFKILGGYTFDSHWGIETTYFSLGKTTATMGNVSAQMKATGFDIAAVYRTDLGNNWALFAKAGLGQTKGETSASSGNLLGAASVNSTQAVFGFGTVYAINKTLSARADLDTRRVTVPGDQSGNVTSINLGLQASF